MDTASGKEVKHKSGKDLSETEVDACQTLWGEVFSHEPKHQVPKDPSLHFSDDSTDYVVAMWNKERWVHDDFFFIFGPSHDSNEARVVAAARLRPVEMSFNGKKFQIAGIANVASHPSVRGQGYGALISRSICDFAKAQKITAVGFCLHSNSPFYIKCGFRIIEKAITDDTWIHKAPDGTIHKNTWDEDVLYVEEEAGFISEVLQHPEIPVFLPVNYW